MKRDCCGPQTERQQSVSNSELCSHQWLHRCVTVKALTFKMSDLCWGYLDGVGKGAYLLFPRQAKLVIAFPGRHRSIAIRHYLELFGCTRPGDGDRHHKLVSSRNAAKVRAGSSAGLNSSGAKFACAEETGWLAPARLGSNVQI